MLAGVRRFLGSYSSREAGGLKSSTALRTSGHWAFWTVPGSPQTQFVDAYRHWLEKAFVRLIGNHHLKLLRIGLKSSILY